MGKIYNTSLSSVSRPSEGSNFSNSLRTPKFVASWSEMRVAQGTPRLEAYLEADRTVASF